MTLPPLTDIDASGANLREARDLADFAMERFGTVIGETLLAAGDAAPLVVWCIAMDMAVKSLHKLSQFSTNNEQAMMSQAERLRLQTMFMLVNGLGEMGSTEAKHIAHQTAMTRDVDIEDLCLRVARLKLGGLNAQSKNDLH